MHSGTKSRKGEEGVKEKTGYERFEAELKETVFAVIFLLVKDEEENLVFSVLDGIVELMQLLSFPFHSFDWREGSRIDMLALVLNLMQVNFYIAFFNWIIYVSVFYLCILLVGLTIIDIFYVSYAISKKKFTYLWPIRVLRSVCGLFVTAFFLPLLEMFFSMMACESDGNGAMVNTTSPDIVCWQGMHILYSVSAIIVSVVFIVISVIVAMTYYDVSWDDDNLGAKTSSDVDVIQIYNKIVCMFVFTFFPDDQYNWLRIVVLLITSTAFYYKLMYKRPYMNHIISLTWCLVGGLYMWTNYMLCINQLVDFSSFAGGIELCFLTYPLVVLFIIYSPNPLEQKLMTPFKDLANGYDCYDHIRFFVFLASHDSVENRVCLEGYIKKYNEEEQDGSSLLRYNQSIMRTNVGESDKKEREQAKKAKMSQERKLMEHAFHLFKKGLAKFPKCTFLRIQYALFLLEKMKNKNWALRQLMKVEKRNPPFDEQFLIYRFKRVIEEEMIESVENDGSASLDIVSALAYQNHRQHWETYMETASQLHRKFWTYLTEDVNDLGKLSEIGSQINTTLALVEEHWDRMQIYKQNSGKVIRLYANFLEQVLNDKEGSRDLLKSVSEGKGVIEDSYDLDNNDELQELNKFAEGGCGVIVASGEGNLGKMNKVSMGVCALFGYTKAELIGKDSKLLLPQLYAEKHKKLIENALDKIDDKSILKERHVYAKHKSGYIMAVDKSIKAVPSIVNNWQYVVCVQGDKKKLDLSVATVLVDCELRITDVSFKAFDLLKLPAEVVCDGKTKISLFVPEIEDVRWIKDFLQMDYKDVLFYYPKEIRLADLAQMETLPNAKPSSMMLRNVTRGTVSTRLVCMAREVNLVDVGLIGYALTFKDPTRSLLSFRERYKDSQVHISNKSKIEWIFHTEKSIFVRVEAERVIPVEELTAAEKSGKYSRYKHQQDPHNNNRDSSSKQVKPTNDQEEDEYERALGEVVFARLARQVNKEWNKPNYAEQITTMRVMPNREFMTLSNKQLAEKQKEILEETEQVPAQGGRKEGERRPQAPIMNMELNSRRDLINAIQNGKTLGAISKLYTISLLMLLSLIVLSSVEYGIFNARYGDAVSYTKVFIKSLDMETQIAQAVENSRNLVLLHSGSLSKYEQFSSATEYETQIRAAMLQVQDVIDATQKEMSELAKKFGDLKEIFILDKTLQVNFKMGSEYKQTGYNLLEAIIMFNAYAIKIANTDLSLLTESNDDVYFVLTNGLNGIYTRLRETLTVIQREMGDYSSKALLELLVIMIFSIGVIFVSGVLLVPYLRNVQKAKEEILMLFFQIKKNHARMFERQCQQFYNSLQKRRNRQGAGSDGEGSDKDIDDEDEEEKALLTSNYASHSIGNTTRRLKKGSSNTLGVVVCELVSNLLFSAYFVLAYVLFGTLLFESLESLNSSFNTISSLSSAYYLDYLSAREMVLNSTWEINSKSSFNSSKSLIDKISTLQESVKDFFSLDQSHINLYFGGFIDDIESVLDTSLCTNARNDYFSDSAQCNEFAHTIPTKGLHPLICFATEISKQLLYEYNYDNFTKSTEFLNGELLFGLRISVKNFIYYNMVKIVERIMKKVDERNSILENIKVGVFVGYILLCAVIYLVIWHPYVKRLNLELIRTKSMVTIIPFEIIRQVTDIQKYVLDNVIFAN